MVRTHLWPIQVLFLQSFDFFSVNTAQCLPVNHIPTCICLDGYIGWYYRKTEL